MVKFTLVEMVAVSAVEVVEVGGVEVGVSRVEVVRVEVVEEKSHAETKTFHGDVFVSSILQNKGVESSMPE